MSVQCNARRGALDMVDFGDLGHRPSPSSIRSPRLVGRSECLTLAS